MIESKIPSNNIQKQSLFSSDQVKCQKLVSLPISQLQDMKNVMMQPYICPIMSCIKYKSVEKWKLKRYHFWFDPFDVVLKLSKPINTWNIAAIN